MLLEKAFIIAFIVFGLHYVMFTPTMILSFVADWSARVKMKNWLSYPLFACPVCMTVYYGTFIYWVFLGSDWKEWIVTVLAAMGINAMFVWFRFAPK